MGTSLRSSHIVSPTPAMRKGPEPNTASSLQAYGGGWRHSRSETVMCDRLAQGGGCLRLELEAAVDEALRKGARQR